MNLQVLLFLLNSSITMQFHILFDEWDWWEMIFEIVLKIVIIWIDLDLFEEVWISSEWILL